MNVTGQDGTPLYVNRKLISHVYYDKEIKCVVITMINKERLCVRDSYDKITLMLELRDAQ